MSPAISFDYVIGDVNITTSADQPQTEADSCALCSLPRSAHGVQFIHRFIPPRINDEM